MVFELDPTMHPDLAPLAWLIGRWEGAGVVGYPDEESKNFGQELDITHDGRPFLSWSSRTWELDAEGTKLAPLATETGYWRPLPDDEVELVMAHPEGVLELYYGKVDGAKIDLATDGVIRSPHAQEYTAAKRLFGLVNSDLMWAMDVARNGHPMASQASAQLKRVG